MLGFVLCSQAQTTRWKEKAADDWYAQQPWLVGSNYIPSYAINELEMWQADTFDPKRIDTELGWAESLGLNTMRVFLHDLLWQQDPEGFKKRIDIFLTYRRRNTTSSRSSCSLIPAGIRIPSSANNVLRRPACTIPAGCKVPGAAALKDPAQYPRLEAYVKGVVGAFANDKRILGWDVWNEPDNTNDGSYASGEPSNKVELVLALLPRVYEWARTAGASQPLTSGVWKGDWSSPEKLGRWRKFNCEFSDVISFHNYDAPAEFEKRVVSLQQYHRPILCTEYMARGNGSTFQGTLPIAKKFHVAAINWGLVAGKTQTYLPWDSWKHPYTDREPTIWFHEIFRTNGQPYSQEEANFIRTIIGAAAARN